MKMRDSGGAAPHISLPRFAGEVPPNGGGGGSSCYLFKLRSIIKF